MTVDLRITGGTLVTADGTVTADLLVDGGRIAGIVSADVGGRRRRDHRRHRQARACPA